MGEMEKIGSIRLMTGEHRAPLGEQALSGAWQYEGAEQYEGYEPDFYGIGAAPVLVTPRKGVPRYAQVKTVAPQAMPTVAREKLSLVQQQESQRYRVTATGDVVDPEPFAISSFTGAPGAVALSVNTVNTRTQIASFTVPVGYRLVFDPEDPYQEVIFTPFTTTGTADANFVLGDFEVTIETATGGKTWRIFHSDTLHMRPASQIATTSLLRKWQHKYVAVPGDLVRFYFTSGTAFGTANSALVARVRAGRIVA